MGGAAAATRLCPRLRDLLLSGAAHTSVIIIANDARLAVTSHASVPTEGTDWPRAARSSTILLVGDNSAGYPALAAATLRMVAVVVAAFVDHK